MVQASAAGFGGGIDVAEILILLELIFVAMVITETLLNGGWDGPDWLGTMQDKVFGWPVCKSPFCVLPSQANVNTIFSGQFITSTATFINKLFFSGGGTPAQLFDFIGVVFAFIDLLKGVVGIYVSITMLFKVQSWIFDWYFKWGVTPGQIRLR